ncbi:hypothetical protein GIY23_12075 [Allosaccharopolyspora coralli]|uniref:Uncharacterized protein n=2 Tax=Allosaccharopolyspora coralli TaxID=2665642 RepID=A0A5Q3QC29_9PSEU|nr:hypothetical protein GIY23_12075 [Allosaccharopolyspora coralli]
MITAWSRAVTAEILWHTVRGPRGMPVVPLTWPQDRTPCAAVPLSHLDDVDSLPHRAAFTVHTGHGHPKTLVATGRVDLHWDLSGAEFVDHLLPQELAKHPPTRLRADSLMARRENWWWIPRALVTLRDITRVDTLPARTHPGDALLVRQPHSDDPEEPRTTVVTAARWPEPGQQSVELWPRDGAALAGEGEAAFVLGHRYSPDFERWERWYRSGTVDGEILHVWSGDGAPQPGDEHPGTAAPLSLLDRLSHHRRVAKACKAGITTVERRESRS